MTPGEVIAKRFEVEARAGSGGMGTVYRARDLRTGRRVALKILHAGADERRFVREAELLAEIGHPAIVGYVAHGVGEGGRYLAMEWLEGESIAARLARGSLGSAEALRVCAAVADAVAALHDRGIVHRDLKPGNVMLTGSTLAEVRLLDLGIARVGSAVEQLTVAGAVLGTPGYMAPEQVRAEGDVGPRADVFALGCVLHACLTGQAAFDASDPLAVMLKVALEDPPLPSAIAKGIAPAVDDLVTGMLRKDAADRPGDIRALGREMIALAVTSTCAPSREEQAPALGTPAVMLGHAEQRVVSLLLVRGLPAGAEARAALSGVIDRVGATFDRLADGTVLVRPAPSMATDAVALLGGAALGVWSRVGPLPAAIVTGRASVGARGAIGAAIERGVALLEAGIAANGVRVDDATAGLLGPGFDVGGDAAGLVLRARKVVASVPWAADRRPGPFVGRAPEIALLESLLDEMIAEPGARVTLLTGAVGEGKSRLLAEWLARVAERRSGQVEIWSARAEAEAAGSPFGLLGRAVRAACGIRDGEPPDVQRRKLAARVGRSGADPETLAPWIGEIAQIPFPDADCPALVAARQDAALMTDRLLAAWERWVALETAARPLVLALEDVQWGDRPSLVLIAAALEVLADRPILVIATGRPELLTAFPDLWLSTGPHHLRLRPLGGRSSRSLAALLLAPERAHEAGRIAAASGGNPFYLRELCRAANAGITGDLPDSVLAMVEARLDALDPELRRILRAASLLGDRCWDRAVDALAGPGAGARLPALAKHELLVDRPESRFAGTEEYAFSHSLVREAAYRSFLPDDRGLGHRIAAAWLEAAGETDPLVLAEGYRKGGAPERAAPFFLAAAKQAVDGGDFETALALVERARADASGAPGSAAADAARGDTPRSTRGELALVAARVRRWLGSLDGAARECEAALDALEPTVEAFWHALGEMAIITARRGHLPELQRLAGRLLDLDPDTARPGPYVSAGARLATQLRAMGQHRDARLVEARSGPLAARAAELDLLAASWVHRAAASRALHEGDVPAAVVQMDAAVNAAERIGHVRLACSQRANTAGILLSIGEDERGLALAKEVLAQARGLRLAQVVARAQLYLGLGIARSGRLAEAKAMLLEAARRAESMGDQRVEVQALARLAAVLRELGEREAAAEAVRRAAVAARDDTASFAVARAVEALDHLANSHVPDAVIAAEEATATLESLGTIEQGEALVLLAGIEGRAAAPGAPGLAAALRSGLARLQLQASRLPDEAARGRFWTAVPEHAAIAARARSLGMVV